MASQLFSVNNPVAGLIERTFLTSRYASGTSLTVKSNEGWANGDIIVAGTPGQEATEASSVSSTSGIATIVIPSALNLTHAQNTPLFLSSFDQIDFERKVSAGSFTAISGSPFTIEWDEEDNCTKILIPTFATTDTLRWRFKNSVTGDVSNYSDEVAGTGVVRLSAAQPLFQVLATEAGKKLKDNVEIIFSFFNDLHDEVEETMPDSWFLQDDSATQIMTAGTYRYALPTNHLAMKFLLYTDSNSQTYPLSYIEEIEMRNLKIDGNQTGTDDLGLWTYYPPDSSSAKGYIAVHSTPLTTGSASARVITYDQYIELTDLDSPGDTLVIPKASVYYNYAMFRIWKDIEDDSDRATIFEKAYLKDLARVISRRSRQKGQEILFKWGGQNYYRNLFGGRPYQSIDRLREDNF